MASAYASGVVADGADAVWALVRRFDALPEWHPTVDVCDMVDGADPRAVGALRRQVLASGAVVHARLVALDDDARTLRYEMLDGPWPVRSYVSTVRVAPITTTGESFVEWWGRYDADGADEARLADDFGRGVYEAGVRALQVRFGGVAAAAD